MSRDITEVIDDYCMARYGHTNWAWTDTLYDEEGHLEEEIQTVSKAYGLHEDDDREEILFYIAENLFEHGRITI